MCEEAAEEGVRRVTLSSALPCFPLFTAHILSARCSLMAFNEPPVIPFSFLRSYKTPRCRASERTSRRNGYRGQTRADSRRILPSIRHDSAPVKIPDRARFLAVAGGNPWPGLVRVVIVMDDR